MNGHDGGFEDRFRTLVDQKTPDGTAIFVRRGGFETFEALLSGKSVALQV